MEDKIKEFVKDKKPIVFTNSNGISALLFVSDEKITPDLRYYYGLVEIPIKIEREKAINTAMELLESNENSEIKFGAEWLRAALHGEKEIPYPED